MAPPKSAREDKKKNKKKSREEEEMDRLREENVDSKRRLSELCEKHKKLSTSYVNLCRNILEAACTSGVVEETETDSAINALALTAVSDDLRTDLEEFADGHTPKRTSNSLPSLPVTPEVSENKVAACLRKLVVRRAEYEQSPESIIPILEERIADLDNVIARLALKARAYEDGLDQLIDCNSDDERRDRIFVLMTIAGRSFHQRDDSDDETESGAAEEEQRARRLGLVPSVSLQLPLDSRTESMPRSLRLHLISELSRTRSARNDWRLVARELNFRHEQIEAWASLRLPMGHVLKEWERSENATVARLLEVLSSASVRATLLAKRISAFYGEGRKRPKLPME